MFDFEAAAQLVESRCYTKFCEKYDKSSDAYLDGFQDAFEFAAEVLREEQDASHAQ